MRVVTILMCLLAICLTGCFESNVASVSATPESNGLISGRLGTEVVENVELGGSVLYSIPDELEDWTYGVYGLVKVPMGEITPYAGAQVTLNEGNFFEEVNPVGGVSVGPVFAEWQSEATNGEDNKVLIGLRFRF